jgi:D-sedoheptulose 7-phosphate isomerase
MSNRSKIQSSLSATIQALGAIKVQDVERIVQIFEGELQYVWVIGNGGSQSNAAHLVLHLRQTGIPAIDLLADNAWLTAESNDLGYHGAPHRGFKGYPMPDVIFVISGSGNSANCVDLARYWRERRGPVIVGLLGMDGGALKRLCDVAVVVNSMEYGPIENAHQTIIHMISAGIGSPVFGPMSNC